ncbi:unnamed protein product [Cyclocybe aegerita]|uniref:Chromatin elongation factor SPT5 n=1 Tax=Cyclocybe aegerita TaxID=1973307 RepID=A0A8S0Y0P5_CYCAE|nr:unnamed protein product [Cyclocybe aegerita]
MLQYPSGEPRRRPEGALGMLGALTWTVSAGGPHLCDRQTLNSRQGGTTFVHHGNQHWSRKRISPEYNATGSDTEYFTHPEASNDGEEYEEDTRPFFHHNDDDKEDRISDAGLPNEQESYWDDDKENEEIRGAVDYDDLEESEPSSPGGKESDSEKDETMFYETREREEQEEFQDSRLSSPGGSCEGYTMSKDEAEMNVPHRGEPKKKKQRTNPLSTNPFVDLEAVVNDNPEIEDQAGEDELWEEFLDDSEGHGRDDTLYTALCTQYTEDDTHWKDFLERAWRRGNRSEASTTENRAPAVQDALWEIPCQMGAEATAVLKILKRACHPEMSTCPARAAFTQPHFPGRIFVEVGDAAKAKQLAKDIAELDPTNLRIVPRDNMTRTLAIHSPRLLQPQSWVRVRSTFPALKLYQDDLALVTRHDTLGRIDVWLLPRPSLGHTASTGRPPQRLVLGGKNPPFSAQGYMVFKSLERTVFQPAVPTVEELEQFRECQALEDGTYHRTHALIAHARLAVHDRVRILRGAFRGLLGVIMSVQAHQTEVFIPSQDLTDIFSFLELRKVFQVGDSVRVVSGEHRANTGWVVELVEDEVIVLNMQRYDEIKVQRGQLEFYEEHQASPLRDLSVYSILSPEDRLEMRDNPNAVHIGKQVTVTGKHYLKGSHGRIKDVSREGEASVALEIFNKAHPEKINLFHLRIRERTGTLVPLSDCNTPSQEEPAHNAPLAVAEDPLVESPLSPASPGAPALVASCSTPFPSSARAIAQSPAWEPGSRTPKAHEELLSLPVPLWLRDTRFHVYRVKLFDLESRSTRPVEFKSILGDDVVVRDGMSPRTAPLQNLRPALVTRKGECVVCIMPGDHFGRLFRVKSHSDTTCVLRNFGSKSGKGEKLFTVPTNALVEVFPPSKGLRVQ